ncbi:hypothetical protein KJA14_00285 [Patescibacteria group bacterium]|nr:hypothetical protein [Patescibacteria group bacterium]
MIKIPLKFKKDKEFFKKILRILGEHIFLSFLVLLFLALILGGFIFYQYSFLAEKLEPQIIEKPLQFEEALYQKISEEWQIRQRRFEETELKEYPDLFRLLILIPEELTE